MISFVSFANSVLLFFCFCYSSSFFICDVKVFLKALLKFTSSLVYDFICNILKELFIVKSFGTSLSFFICFFMGNLFREFFSLVSSQQILELAREWWHFDSEFFHDSLVKVTSIYFLLGWCHSCNVILSLIFVKLFTSVLHWMLNLVSWQKKSVYMEKFLLSNICVYTVFLSAWHFVIFLHKMFYIGTLTNLHENRSRNPISILASIIILWFEKLHILSAQWSATTMKEQRQWWNIHSR